MIAVPSIVMLMLVSGLSLIGSAILSKRWQKNLALGLAAFEMSMAIGLVVLVLAY